VVNRRARLIKPLVELRGLEPLTLTLPGSGPRADQGVLTANEAVELVAVVPNVVIVVVRTVVNLEIGRDDETTAPELEFDTPRPALVTPCCPALTARIQHDPIFRGAAENA
jgi:hypothetical protein